MVNVASGSGNLTASTGDNVSTYKNTGNAVTDGANGTPRISTETRMTNIALIAQIKY
jgi:hypothetical protein